ncbi:MAG: hypothetical protein AB8H79_14410 [Myxococcota bacterium]
MRHLILLLCVGCMGTRSTPTDIVEFDPWPEGEVLVLESTLNARAEGAALGPNFMAAGLGGLTVQLLPETESIRAEVEALPGFADKILSAGRRGTGDVALVQTPDDLRLISFDPPPGVISDFFRVRQVRDAIWTESGVLAFYEYEPDLCELRWLDQEDPVLTEQACRPSTFAQTADDTVVMGLGTDGVYRIQHDPPTAERIADEGLFTAWDATTQRVWFAGSQAQVLNNSALDGSDPQSINLEGPITALTALGSAGRVVWVENDGGRSTLVAADAAGVTLERLQAEGRIDRLDADDVGGRILVVRSGDLATYRVE